MKNQILEKATELFLHYGFKSVTMDDIAKNIGVSKKTIYKYYSDKETLVGASVAIIQQNIHHKMKAVQEQGLNAVEENFKMNDSVDEFFGNLDESPAYQLEKYYPEKYKRLISNSKEFFIKGILIENLEKGIEQGLYRKDINIKAVALLYHSLSVVIHTSQKNTDSLCVHLIEYHTRAIATEKGVQILEKELNRNKK